MLIAINIFLTILTAYLALGLLFSIYFVFAGANKIDPLMQITKKKVLLLILPGVIATWPVLLRKMIRTKVN